MNLSTVDVAIVVVYFVLMLGIGVYAERRAGKDLESYFLGGRSMPWWLLGMSGCSTYFDITGTMWMVAVFYDLGMRGMWQHAFWCFPFAGFVMAYKAKWAYRSEVLTGMEWVVFRYGDGRAGRAARLMSVFLSLVSIVFILGYSGTGVGKFITEFLPVNGSLAVAVLFILTGIYVIMGGFFSVVYTDFIQTILLALAALYISVVAFLSVDPDAFRQLVGDDWFSLAPVKTLPEPHRAYPEAFGLLVLLWVTRGLIVLVTAAGGAEFQRFRAARTEGEASKVGFAWGLAMSVRWSMVMGFTVFGLSILATDPSATGTVDSESVLPMMVNRTLPIGVKGLVLAGLLAAFMSTYDSLLNLAASFIVNDLVKPVWKDASAKSLIRVSHFSTMGVVVLGILISMLTDQIAAIWNPINFALGAALLAPTLLAAYWWRINGWTVCLSGAFTLSAALYVKVFTEWRELEYFPVLAGISLITCLIGAYAFPATPRETLIKYYRKVRPFGLWGPVRVMLREEGEDPRRPASDRYDIPVAIVGTAFFIALYVLMMDLVLHNWPRVAVTVVCLALCAVFLYAVWWRRLEQK